MKLALGDARLTKRLADELSANPAKSIPVACAGPAKALSMNCSNRSLSSYRRLPLGRILKPYSISPSVIAGF